MTNPRVGAKTKAPMTKHQAQAKRKALLSDPDIILFAGEAELAVGGIDRMALGWGDLFGRPKDAVRQDWEKLVGQINYLLDGVSAATKDYALDEIAFELGFSAEGQLVFVAKAGITTTIRATFKHK